MDESIESVGKLFDVVVKFVVAYGFQAIGALVVLFIGLKLANWIGLRTTDLAMRRKIDVPLAQLLGTATRFVTIGLVVVITLGNFGISIAPLIALASASAFGATIALQGPLSNYGAGLSIIMGRAFTVGDVITVKGVSGIVEKVTLASTTLRGEDGEVITIPNKEIVGEVITSFGVRRIVEMTIPISISAEADKAVAALKRAIADFPDVAREPSPQIGVHDFTPTGVVLGIRYWVPASGYFTARHAVNAAFLKALHEANVALPRPPAPPPAAPA
ncbi:MAG: mechanosensitive ion channel [Rhodospirillales bacterium]|nr:mechanosensitive ion channel [Rhodospirillales bacterium]